MSLSVLSTQKYLEQRKYSYNEAMTIAMKMAKEVEQSMAEKYDMLYTLVMISCLTAEPFRFGKKRVNQFVDMFFGQVDSFNSKAIEIDDLLKEAERVGVHVTQKDGKFTVDVK